MTAKPHKIPGPDHPISIARNPKRVTVSIAGKIVADTCNALTMREASYPLVQYIPREDVDMAFFSRTQTATHCPYKGDASYFSAEVDGKSVRDAAWSYEQPCEAVATISGYLAFYPDRVEAIGESEA